MFPGRRGAGRIFHNQVALSGKVPQICCLFGPSAAGGAYIPSLHRPHHHGRGQRLDVPRQPADGRDGRRRDGLARGDGRRPDALHRLGRRRPARRPTTSRPSSWPSSTSPTCPSSWRSDLPAYAPGGAVRAADPAHRARAREPAVRHPRGHRRAGRRRVVLRDQAALRARARHRLRPDGRRDRRHRRQQLGGQGRRALHRQRRQGRALHLAVRRASRSRWSTSPTCRAS